jgi:ABC-type transporter Mla subunit MlaD
MKKLLILAIFFLLCACGLGQTTQADTSEVRRSTDDLRAWLQELERLRDNFKDERIKETEYLNKAPQALDRFKNELDQLNKRLDSYLDNLEGEQEALLRQELESPRNKLDKAFKEINGKFSAKPKKITDGIDNFVSPVSDALNNIDRIFYTAAINSRQGAGRQSSPKPITTSQPSQGQDQGQSETSDFAYEPYMIPLFLFIAVGVVTWWLHNRLAKLERALGNQNQAVPQLRQQLDEQLDAMWQELSKLQQQEADAQRQSHLQLLAEVERLRAAVQAARTQPSSAEPRIVRRRVEEPAEYEPSAVVAATPRLASAADYLRRATGGGIRAKAAMLRPDVLQPAEDDGPYLLLPADGQPNIYNVIPAVPRFQSAQDYSHFSHFYDCDQPSSGEVFIVQPARAVYDHTADQWKLRSKGRLQIS